MATKSNENNGASEIENGARAQGPQGQRLALNITPAFLSPEAGFRTAQQPLGYSERCGLLWGAVDYGYEHANQKNPAINSIRWHGTFGYQKADGSVGGGATIYVPSVIERQLRSLGVLIQPTEQAPPRQYFANAEFSIEIWCERDIGKPGRVNAQGYVYAVYNLQQPPRDISHLAPPEVRPLLPAPAVERLRIATAQYDPETGEWLADRVEPPQILPPDAPREQLDAAE